MFLIFLNTEEGAREGPSDGVLVGVDEGEDADGEEVTGDRVGSVVGSDEVSHKKKQMSSLINK